MKKLISIIFLIGFHISPQGADIRELHFFLGTWKQENKENYESWKIDKGEDLTGLAYKKNGGLSRTTEYLSIRKHNGQIIYTARVPNQNNAQSIDFILKKMGENKYSFENAEHDFPKKIQYTKENDTTLLVEVLGSGNKGFSYKLLKVRDN
jgi:hypothetical protein